MYYSAAIVVAAIAAQVSAHGVITEIQGANGVNMAGLSVIDGTPRSCGTPFCGSEDDTTLVRAREMGTNRASALGRSPKGGPIDAGKMISIFMGTSGINRRSENKIEKRQLLSNLLGLGGGNAGQGQRTRSGASETGVSRMAGMGAGRGLPTASDDGIISMTYHQINQDGAGPLTAMIDPSSGGTDPKAFQRAEVIQNVPGTIGGLSLAAVMDWPVKVKMPQGMTCTGSAGGVEGVCIVRLNNDALAGPFGGSAAFTQSRAGVRRSVESNLRKRHIARGILASEN